MAVRASKRPLARSQAPLEAGDTGQGKEETLQRSRRRQSDKRWKGRYRATRPKVERKFGQLMQRRHGGRRSRV
ncbi:MAG TPA: hypothetical protein VH877_27560, partial [Polyangia bacterium]|nr:hypothetical protein [Polyangia bacterium]